MHCLCTALARLLFFLFVLTNMFRVRHFSLAIWPFEKVVAASRGQKFCNGIACSTFSKAHA
jgi:hypothetical protein